MAEKDGIASGKARQQRKTFNELFNAFLDRQVTNEQVKEQLKQFGFKDEELTNKNAMVFAQYREALKGSTQAYVAVRDTVGEKPVDTVQNINPPQIVIERPKE